MIIIVV